MRGIYLLAAAGVFWCALSPQMDVPAERSFAVHMLQHLLILLVAPVLVLLSHPFAEAPRLFGKAQSARITRWLRSVAFMSYPPFSLSAFVAVLWLTHFSPLYNAALESEPVHICEHVIYFAAGLIFWLPVVPQPPFRPISHPARLLYLLIAMPQGALLSMALGSARRPLYPHYALHAPLSRALLDQQAAAAVMWISGGMLLFAAFLMLLGRWARREAEAMEPACVLVLGVVLVVSPARLGAAESGSAVYAQHCAACHGLRGSGSALGPSLRGLPASDVHLMLDTGRMPATTSDANEIRRPPTLTAAQIDALVDYVATLSPASDRTLPLVREGDPLRGRRLYAMNCQQCHGAGGDGADAGSDVAPSLASDLPAQIAEAIRGGPAVMPRFSRSDLTDRDVDDIVGYVGVLQRRNLQRQSLDAGGIGMSHAGAIAEGLVAALSLGLLALWMYAISRA